VSDTLTGIIILEPRGRGGATLLIEGRTFVIRGRLLKGLRDLAKELRASHGGGQ
jgi:hypothetical protein